MKLIVRLNIEKKILYFGTTLDIPQKTIIMRILVSLFLVLGLSSCKSTKTDSNPPFTISGATYNYWVGGQPGVSGIRVIINYTTTEDISFDKIYFQKKEGTIDEYQKDGKTFIIGRINTSKREGNELIMHADPKEEMKNKPPQGVTFPTGLKENDAMLVYTYKGKTYSFKVTDIKQTESDFYP
jgi:hypothetical protein